MNYEKLCRNCDNFIDDEVVRIIDKPSTSLFSNDEVAHWDIAFKCTWNGLVSMRLKDYMKGIAGVKMITTEMRFELTKNEIEYAENIDEHWELFHKGIALLEKRIQSKNFSEFDEEEQEILEEIYSVIEY